MQQVPVGNRNPHLNEILERRQQPQSQRNLSGHVPVGVGHRVQDVPNTLHGRTTPVFVPQQQPSQTHSPVGQRLNNDAHRNRPQNPGRTPPTRQRRQAPSDPFFVPLTNTGRRSQSRPTVIGGRNKSGLTKFINGLGKVPFLGTIVGIIRIAVSCLKLTVSSSPITHYYAKQDLRRGFLELIPFIGGALLVNRDK